MTTENKDDSASVADKEAHNPEKPRRGILHKLKIAGLAVILVAIITAIALPITYSISRANMTESLEGGSQIAETSNGPVEYARTHESSTAKNHVLILHGTPGGYDAGLMLVEWLQLGDDTQCIVPSRPGYLRTPIDSGKTPREAATTMVELLDTLEIEKVTVLGWSGGGPTAIALAEHFPDRVEGLVLLSARILGDDKYYFTEGDEKQKPFDPDTVEASADFWGPDFSDFCKMAGFHLMPAFFLKTFFPDDVVHKDLTVQRLVQMSSTTQPPSCRAMGRHNDYWQFASLSKEPAFNIKTPTLIIHSPIDESVSFDHAVYLSKAIAHAELFEVENESHFSTLNTDAADKFKSFIDNLN